MARYVFVLSPPSVRIHEPPLTSYGPSTSLTRHTVTRGTHLAQRKRPTGHRFVRLPGYR